MALVQEALDEVGLGPEDITTVIATGGTSHIPFIRQGLTEFFDTEILEEVDPQESVALGAAAYAHRLAPEPGGGEP
jgi:molecular chaperone DnaK (HSP70)